VSDSAQNIDSHAVIVGGSIAGMLAARALSNHFDRVTIIERDRLPQSAEPRKGVPQSRHIHALMMRGKEIIEELFPGVCRQLIDAGSAVLDIGSDVKWLTPAGWGLSFQSGLTFLSFSRDLLDATIRDRLRQISNISFLENCDVTGLIPDATGNCVAGVSLTFADPASGERREKEVSARLVIDASGRGSRLPEWLERLGYQRPGETVVNAHLGYASRLYQRPAGVSIPWRALLVGAAPPNEARAGLVFPLEGQRWIVTLVGGDRDYPGTDEEGFIEFARSLRSSELYRAIEQTEPLTPIYGTRSTENRFRHFDQLTRWPERLLVIGDGACAFNPVYAQGMTTAAIAAVSLDRCLSVHRSSRGPRDLNGFARCFLKELGRINRAPWALATGQDYRYRGTQGASVTRKTKFMNWYMDHVFQLGTRNAAVRRRFLEVQQMVKSPVSMFHYEVVMRVIGQALRSLI
jgi:2-polyprenyl-6-methoxyphenol hydroxylase-like FAD-dependent oxidoreductase